MEKRPIIAIESTIIDKCLEVISWLLLILLWTATLVNYVGNGIACIISVLATLIFVLITVRNKYPHRFNYPVNITASNAPVQYLYALRMMRCSKCTAMLILYFIVLNIYSIAEVGTPVFGVWILYLTVLLFVAAPVVFIILMYKNK